MSGRISDACPAAGRFARCARVNLQSYKWHRGCSLSARRIGVERRKPMLQKRTYKVLAAIPKRDGGHYWMRCGNGHTNKDDSINVYLDVMPRDLKFTLRELDEEDLRRREAYRATHGDAAPASTDAPPF
jgi:hypothetical protein